MTRLLTASLLVIALTAPAVGQDFIMGHPVQIWLQPVPSGSISPQQLYGGYSVPVPVCVDAGQLQNDPAQFAPVAPKGPFTPRQRRIERAQRRTAERKARLRAKRGQTYRRPWIRGQW